MVIEAGMILVYYYMSFCIVLVEVVMHLVYLAKYNGTNIENLVNGKPFIKPDHVHVLHSASHIPFLFKAFKASDFDADAWIASSQYRATIEAQAKADARCWAGVETFSGDEQSIELNGPVASEFDVDGEDDADLNHALANMGVGDLNTALINQFSSPAYYQQKKTLKIDYLKPMTESCVDSSLNLLEQTAEQLRGDVRKQMLYNAFTYRILAPFYSSLQADKNKAKTSFMPHHDRYMDSLKEGLANLEHALRGYFTGDDAVYLQLFIIKKSWPALKNILIEEAARQYVINGFDYQGTPDLFSEQPFTCNLMHLHVAEIIDRSALLATHFIASGYDKYYSESMHESTDLISKQLLGLIYLKFNPMQPPKRIFFEDLSQGSQLPRFIAKELNTVALSVKTAIQLDKYLPYKFNDKPVIKSLQDAENSFIHVAEALSQKEKALYQAVNFFSIEKRQTPIRIDEERFLVHSQVLISVIKYLIKSTAVSDIERTMFAYLYQCVKPILNHLVNLSEAIIQDQRSISGMSRQ